MRRVLVVDDSALIRAAARMGLEGVFEVSVAESGEEGLEQALATRPDLILLDVVMPGIGGPETLAALRATEGTREVPVIFVTAEDGDEDRRRFEALGAAGVISKPFEPARLAAAVDAILEGTE